MASEQVIRREDVKRALAHRWVREAAVICQFCREAAGLTREQVAERLGWPVRKVAAAEREAAELRLSEFAQYQSVCGFLAFDVQLRPLSDTLRALGVPDEPAAGAEGEAQR